MICIPEGCGGPDYRREREGGVLFLGYCNARQISLRRDMDPCSLNTRGLSDRESHFGEAESARDGSLKSSRLNQTSVLKCIIACW